MSDPRRIKNLGRIVMDLKYDDMSQSVKFYTFVDGEKIKNIPQEVVMAKLKPEISKVSLKRGTELYRTLVSYSYSEGSLTGFDYGNTLVEVNLPYCLHFPNHSDFNVKLKEQKLEAVVTFQKIWTKRASTEEGKSDTIDFYADDHNLYFQKSTILGPRLPYVEEDGWDSNVKGRNIEKLNDQNGTFRYTKLYIQLNLDLLEKINKLSEGQLDKLLKGVEEKSLLVVNRIIDNYRELTGEMHVRRLGDLKVNLIYFIKQNVGFYLSNFNITTALLNRSRTELKELQSKLSSGSRPSLYKLLLLNAKDSLRSKDFTLAIVESFQALEIFLENYLIEEFKKKGKTESQYKKILETSWRTKERLNKVLKDLKGTSLNHKSELWDPWCNKYDKTRKEVVHLGKEPTEMETSETLSINEQVINWILSLQSK